MQRLVGLFLALLITAGAGALSTPSAQAGSASLPQRVSCNKTYTIVSGDYWYGIAQRHKVSLTSLLAINDATADSPIMPGQVICLPDFATVPATEPPATTPPTVPATTVPSSTVPATTTPSTPATEQVVALSAFPVQGPCTFGDTYGATRSGGRSHEGVDVIAKTGQLVYAVVAGTLTRQTTDKPGSLSGNAWWLTGADRTYYFYAHLAAFAPGLKVGSKVVAGQFIGYVGATGNAGSPHLHLEIHPGGGASINPTASVRAVDGCKTKEPLPQPDGVAPPALSEVLGTSTPVTTTPAAAPVVVPPTNSASPAGGGWQFIAPANAFDTARSGARAAAWSTRTVRVDNLTGVDPTTTGVMIRLTAWGAASRGFLIVHRCDAPVPTAATLSYPSGATAVGSTIVTVTAGTVCVTSNHTVNLRMEVIAHRSAAGVGLQPISSIRALDTRESGRMKRGTPVTIPLSALGVVAGTEALSATITIVDPSSAGTVGIGFCGAGLWNVPVGSDSLSSFAIAMRVSASGWCVTSTMATDIVIDITGLWVGGGALAPVDAARVYDSRIIGVRVGPTPVPIQIAGQGGAPATATQAVLSISNVAGSLPGIVFAVPCDAGRSVGVVSAGTPNRISSAVVPVKLGNGAICVSALEPVDLIIDVLAAG